MSLPITQSVKESIFIFEEYGLLLMFFLTSKNSDDSIMWDKMFKTESLDLKGVYTENNNNKKKRQQKKGERNIPSHISFSVFVKEMKLADLSNSSPSIFSNNSS